VLGFGDEGQAPPATDQEKQKEKEKENDKKND